MKKLSHLLLMVAAAAFILTSCEGPAGPEGPIGPAGPKGDTGNTGAIGPQGESGTAGCIECHDNSATITTKSAQYENSLHATGENASYANRTGCAECHTNQGFHEYKLGVTSTAPYAEAQQQNCYTCHDIHSTYSETDWALTYPETHNMLLDGTAFDKGKANLCANCHQARAIDPVPVIDGTDVDLGSRYGTHHGPVANMLLGTGFFEFGTGYSNSMHSMLQNGCVSCHMATPYSNDGGGHSMNMEYESHETPTLSDAGCVDCHTKIYRGASVPGYDLAALKTFQLGVQTKLDILEDLLVSAGVYNLGTELNNTGTFPANVAASFVNYQSVKEDRSLGVHNPKYINKLLDNTIVVMEAIVNPPAGK